MTDEKKPVEDDEDDDEMSVADEFRTLYVDTKKLTEKWIRLAKMRAEEGDTVSAGIYRQLAGDLLPLMEDSLAATGAAFEELEAATAEAAGGEGMDGDDAVVVYSALYASELAFKQLADASFDADAKEKLTRLAVLNAKAMEVLQENYEDIAEESLAQINEAQEPEEE
jgi:hypothetical protein